MPTPQSGGFFTFANLTSSGCLDDTSASKSSGTQFDQWACASGDTNHDFGLSQVGTVPTAPAGLTATPSPTQISLSWTASSGATTYNVYRGTTAGGESTTALATAISATTYADSTATAGTTYYYEVKAVNAAGTSTASNEASAALIVTPAAALSLCFLGTNLFDRKKRRILQRGMFVLFIGVTLLGVTALTGCAGGGATKVTVTATSGSVSQTTSFILTVN